MENVVLVVHLLLALSLIGIVLMQRSEGGGLGMGGGSGGGLVSARGAATALGKLTWILAIGFIITSIALTIIATEQANEGSVVDGATPAVEDVTDEATTPALDGEALLPPSTGDAADAPLLPGADQ